MYLSERKDAEGSVRSRPMRTRALLALAAFTVGAAGCSDSKGPGSRKSCRHTPAAHAGL